MVNKLL